MTRISSVLARIVVLAGLAAMAACSTESNGAPPTGGRPAVAVTVAPVVEASLEQSIEVVGAVQPKFSADVKSEVTGTVREVYVTEWVPVKKGQRLARLDTSEAEARIAALEAVEAQGRVAESRARREYERAQQLKEFGLITPQAFDDARSAVEAAEAATRAAAAQVAAAETGLAKSLIVAPMDGVVAFRGVSVGDRVENMGGDAPLFRIVDNRLLDLTVSVPSSRLAEVRVGQPIDFSTDALPDRTFTGQVRFINPEIDPASRSARVVAEVVNRDGALKGGSFVKGRIVVERRAGVRQVPREALLNWNLDERTADLFVAKGDQVEKQRVHTGSSNGTMVEITSGVQTGDQVVVRGGFSIRPGDKVAITTGEGA
ncbi:MAG: efflux RND transporter periplasmic adaptor subunit [Acidobacteriota bacterium]